MTSRDETLTAQRAAAAAAPSTAPHLFLVLECARPTAGAARYRLDGVDEVRVGRGSERGAAIAVEDGRRILTVRVPDRRMSSSHALLRPGLGTWELTDAGSKNGSLVGGRPVAHAHLRDGDLVELGHTCFLYRHALPHAGGPEIVDLAVESAAEPSSGLARLLPTLQPTLAQDLERLDRIARSPVSVLLGGATGTGKELVARAIHARSGRRGAFVAVNCGALPRDLVESHLSGHRRGAFSGATEDQLGLVRAADGGTLLLDEIGDLPLPAQAALLRILQEREVLPVGDTRPVAVDVRFLAATHRDLDALVAAGAFREDLLARLRGFSLSLPRLADRREDLGLIVGLLLRRLAGAGADAVSLTPEAARQLVAADWPGNVRGLEKALEAALVLAAGAPLDGEHLREQLGAGAVDVGADPDAAVDVGSGADPELLREQLVALLRLHRGNVSAIARATGKARMQIQRWLRRHHLDPAAYRDG